MANGNLLATVVETDWKLVQGPDDPAALGVKLIREIQNFDATTANDAMVTLAATLSLNNPKADGIIYATVATPSTAITTYYLSAIETKKQMDGRYPGSISIVETLTKVKTIAVEADLPAAPIIQRGSDLIEPFGLKSVTEDMMAYKWLYLNPVNAAVINAMSLTTNTPAGYTVVQRRTVIEDLGDRTCTLNVLFKKISGTAWGGAPDLIDYFDVGSKAAPQAVQGEQNGMIKYWFSIQKSDLAAGIAAIRDGTGAGAATAGYIITRAVNRDNHDGTITFEQTSVKQVLILASDTGGTHDQKIANPLGFYPVTLDECESIYQNYTRTDILAIVEPTKPTNYSLLGSPVQEQGDGLWTRTFRYRKSTCPNTTPVLKIVRETGAATTDNQHNVQKAFGVPIAQAEANIQTLKLNADDANYVTEDVSFDTNDETGEAVITRTRKKVGTDSNAFVVAEMSFNYRLSTAGIWTGIKVYWPSLSPTFADNVVIPQFVLSRKLLFSVYGLVDTFDLMDLARIDNGDGTIKVVLVCNNPIYLGLIEDGDKEIENVLVSVGGSVYQKKTTRRYTSSRSQAVDWVNLGSTAKMPAGARHQNSPEMTAGGYEWDDAGHRYKALRVEYTTATALT